MVRQSLDIYDDRPLGMINYLRYNGWHFNKKMCDFAISMMKKLGTPITPIDKEKLDSIMKLNKINIINNVLYDYIYVANMCKADFLGSSVPDETRLALYVKDVIDDEDGYDGIVFNRWYADMCKKGVPIDWDEMI